MNSIKVFARYQNLFKFNKVSFLGSQRAFASIDPDSEPLPKEKRNVEKTINQVTLLGRVGSEPLKKGTDDHPVVVFSLATHNNYKYESGEYLEKTDWHKICIFKPSLRDMAYNYLKKGQRVYVTGKISYGSVTENNILKTSTSIIADDIIFFYSGEM